jgi:hypothetical protein
MHGGGPKPRQPPQRPIMCNQNEELTMQTNWRKEQAPDLANLVFGTLLIISPWALGFIPESAIAWNAALSGSLVVLLALAALALFQQWQAWASLAAGLWIAVSPWVMGFAGHTTGLRVHLIIGPLVAIAAVVRLWLERQPPTRVTA